MLSDHHPSTSTPIRRLSASVFGTSSSPLSPVLSQSYKIRRTPSLTQSQGCISWSASSPVVNSDSSIKKKDLSPRTLGGMLRINCLIKYLFVIKLSVCLFVKVVVSK